MFCSKCGTQVPDGSRFCLSCGNPINMQPTAPAMPVEPVAPIMEEPVMVTPVMEAPVMEAPVMEAPVMDTPIMTAPVVEESVTDIPSAEVPVMEMPTAETPVMEMPVNEAPFMPVADPFMTAPNNYVNQYPVNNEPTNVAPKKSKAPLFIALGIIGLIVVILSIVLILIFGKGDDKKNDKKSKETTKSSEAATDENSTEKESAEEESTDSNSGTSTEESDISDAETMVKNFMNAVASSNYSKASKYLLPALAEAMEDLEYMEAAEVVEDLASIFTDSNGDVLDYEITDVSFEDSYYFDEVASTLDDYSSYEEPTTYAEAEIYFTYETQSSYFYLELAYVDGDWYIFDYDDDYFDIELDSETDPSLDTDTDSDFDFDTAIDENYIYLTNSVEGSNTDLGDYYLTIPEDWTLEDDSIYDSAYENLVTFETESLYSQTKEEYLKDCCESVLTAEPTYFDFGNVSATYETGYYIEAEVAGTYFFAIIFFNEAEDTAYQVGLFSSDSESDNCRTAEAIVASLQIK